MNLSGNILKEQEEILNSKKLVVPKSHSTKKISYVVMENSPEDSYIIGANTIKSVRDGNPVSKVTPIKESDYAKTFIEVNKNSFKSLETIHADKQLGIIAKKGMSDSVTTCQRRIEDRFIEYNGNNLEEIMEFCRPFEAFKTKKKNIYSNITRAIQHYDRRNYC